MSTDSYVLAAGIPGAERLRLLSQAAWPATAALLGRIRPQRGWRCLDVGCGIGTVTVRLARRTGHCLGVDREQSFVDGARRGRGAAYQMLDIGHLDRLQQTFDLVYARYVLSHQTDASNVLMQMLRRCRRGGVVAVEDVDFPGHTWHPESAAMQTYVDLYQQLVRSRGGDPQLGRKLGALFERAGLVDVQVRASLALDGTRRVAPLTLAHIGDAAIAQGLITAGALARLVGELEQYAAQKGAAVSLAPTFQVWGRVG